MGTRGIRGRASGANIISFHVGMRDAFHLVWFGFIQCGLSNGPVPVLFRFISFFTLFFSSLRFFCKIDDR